MKSTTPAASRQAARDARIQAIVDGAHVRERLGQSALYEHRNGEHVVVFRGERYAATTLEKAIRAARGKSL